MSLDVTLTAVRPTTVFDYNITHNLTEMASAAGLYEVLWRPEEVGIKTAQDLVPHLAKGLAELKAYPQIYKAHNPPNSWGNYDNFVEFVHKYLDTCLANPDATVEVCR